MADLVQVLSAQVFRNKVEGEDDSIDLNNDKLYGGIVVYDNWGRDILCRHDGSVDSFLPDGTIFLNTPSRCSYAEHWHLRVKFHLKKNENENENDLELCDGFLRITLFDEGHLYDRPLKGVVHGRDGYAVVYLAVFVIGVQATVEVSLRGTSCSSLYGYICARNALHKHTNSHEKKYFCTTMFSASQARPRPIEGTKIPLSRSVVAAQLWTGLVIEAELFTQPTPTSTPTEVASGDALFEARPDGDKTLTIGCIEVKITWTKLRVN